MWCLSMVLFLLSSHLCGTVQPDPPGYSIKDKQQIIDCDRDHIRCHDGVQCVNRTLWCNGFRDCDDGSDEYLCVNTIVQSNCSDDEFSCIGDQKCFPRKYLCDSAHDCVDGSDEAVCVAVQKCEVKYNRFLCDNRQQCINTSKVCNDQSDCADGSDESGICDTAKEECDRGKCGEIGQCIPSPTGAVCVCPAGYTLTKNMSRCQDNDECSDMPCDHSCINTLGSYHCSCSQGYTLVQGHRCFAQGPDPKLYVAANTKILEYDVRTDQWRELFTSSNRITDIAYGPDSNLYWTETDPNGKALYTASLHGRRHLLKQTVVNTGLDIPEGVAVDWGTGHVYLADRGHGRIVCCTNRGDICTVVLQGLHHIRSLAIHQVNRKMYWSTWINPARIEISDLDGGQRSEVINERLGHPSGLFIEYVAQRLYWVDSILERLESARFDGTHRKIILARNMGLPFAVAVFEDRLYWTDTDGHSVHACGRREGCKQIIDIKTKIGRPTGITVGHPAAYPTPPNNPCEYQQCSHLCLPSNGHYSYSCACPPDHKLQTDGKRCTRLWNATDLFIGGRRAFLKLPLSSIGYLDTLVKSKSLQKIDHTPVSLAINPHRNQMFFTEGSAIIMAEWGDTVIEKKLFSTNVGKLCDLVVHWDAGNIFWADIVKGTIDVGRTDGSLHATLLSSADGVKRPNALDIDTREGYLYFSDVDSDGYIGACPLSMVTPCVQIPGLTGRANKILLDHTDGRLYISYEDYHQIISVTVRGGNRRVHWQGSTVRPFSMAVVDDWIYFTPSFGFKEDGLFFVNKNDINKEGVILKSQGHLLSLAVRDNLHTWQVTTGCDNKNGGCEHICLPVSQTSVRCKCADEFTLQKDNRTCKGIEHVTQTYTTTGILCSGHQCSDGQCIPQTYVCDDRPDCLDESDEKACPDKSESASDTAVGSANIDECQTNNGNCSQKCLNLEGARTCWCVHGYNLTKSTDCVVAEGPSPYFVVGGEMGIQIVNWTSHLTQEVELDEARGEVVALDVNMATQDIMFSTALQAAVYMKRKLDGKTVVLVPHTQGYVHDVAYDWLGTNIYYTTDELLVACELKSLTCRTLLHQEVRHLTLGPPTREIFFTTSAENNIYTMWMDGTGQRVLVSIKYNRPAALTIDHPADRLYWLESTTNRVQSCRLDGSDRYVVIQHVHLVKFTSIAVFENHIYLSDFQTKSICSFHKGKHAVANGTIPLASRSLIVKVVHPLLQVWSHNDCDKLHCSHLCLLGNKGGNCYCPDGYRFTSGSRQQCTNVEFSATKKSMVEVSSAAIPGDTSVAELQTKAGTTPSAAVNTENGTTLTHDVKRIFSVSCSDLTCQNGGQCIVTNNSTTCRCLVGFHGSLCEESAFSPQQNYFLIVGLCLGAICFILGLLMCAFCWSSTRSRDKFRRCRGYLKNKHCSNKDDTEELVTNSLFQNANFINTNDSSYHDFDDVSYQMFISDDFGQHSPRNHSSSVDSDFISHRSSNSSSCSRTSKSSSSSSQS